MSADPTAAAGAVPPPSSTDPSAAATGGPGAPNPADGVGSDVSNVTQINSLADLREKAPKVYNAMMQGIAMNVTNDMKHHQEELKKLQKEYERK